MDVRSFILLLLAALFCQSISAEKLRICVVESIHTAKRIHRLCPKFGPLRSQIECVIGNDRFNCLRRLITGNADFTVLEPEDLIAVAAYNEYNILVTNELKLFPNEKQRFEMVVIVNKNVNNRWDIKGNRLCHPGLETEDDWTKAFSTYFENWVIPRECDPTKTLLENRVMGLSNFFEAACVAGPWSADTVYDNKLKSKYKNLCATCDNPAGCYSTDKYHGREGALLCLTDNAGDVAWVRLDDTLEFFKVNQINKTNYNYLCPDDTTRPVGFDKPCVWITKPWPVVVARSEMAQRVSMFLSSLPGQNIEKQTILQLMESYHVTPVSTDNLETPDDYLRRFSGFMSANNRANCRPSRTVQWCVASNLEDRKCRWLREAAIVYGVEPMITCIQEQSKASCLEAVRTKRADIVVARPEELLDARKKGLVPVVQAVPKKNEDLNRIAAIVKQDSRFKNLHDLKGAKACFAGYKDVAWNSFVTILRNLTGGSRDCSDASVVGNFFKESCVPGLGNDRKDVPYNVYSLCKQGRIGNDVGAVDCLDSGIADVAIGNLKNIEKKTGSIGQSRNGHARNKEYRTLCLNEEDAEQGKTCLITWATLSTIVVNENTTSLRREEIYSMLLEMDQLFGVSFKGQTPAFSLYGIYDFNRSVIFPEETQHLQFDVHQIQRVQNYNEIVENIAKRPACSGAIKLNFDYGNTILLYISFRVLNKLLNG